MVLKPSEARAFYDRFGKKQDVQSFYEDPALDDPIAHARFAGAVEGAIRRLKHQEVSGRLQAIVTDIRRRQGEERPALFQSLRTKLEEVIGRKRDVPRLLAPSPVMRGPAAS